MFIIPTYKELRMSEEKLAFVGKQVKDIYGTHIGRVVGIITEIDGEIESVGVDCGSSGMKQLPYEQLVLQGEYVFFIPKWRLEAQKLIRQKSLTLKRMKALQEIVAENDGMKEDAELVTIKYEKKMAELGEYEKAVSDKLVNRLSELDAETKQVKAVLFDAKLQFRSNELKEETYQQIKVNTDELVEHISNEKTEITNVKGKLSSLTIESITTELQVSAPAPVPESAPTIEASKVEVQSATTTTEEEKPIAVTANSNSNSAGGKEGQEGEWLNQVMKQ